MTLEQFVAKRLLKDAYSEERALFVNTLMRLSREGHLCWQTSHNFDWMEPAGPIVHYQGRYYLARNWALETYILDQVRRLRALKPPGCAPLELDGSLLAAQQSAVRAAINNTFSLICGGPGTGKTYTAGVLARVLAQSSPKKSKYKIVLAAPTGKAASHLQAVLGPIDAQVGASTLHRLLQLKAGETKIFSPRIIDADLVIVDEASMLDVSLLAQLLGSIGCQTRLVLMGDPNQLPPVEAGSLFAEMADLFGFRLERSMRTENHQLLDFAAQINQGQWSDTAPILPFSFDDALPAKLFDMTGSWLFSEKPEIAYCLKQLHTFRVLSALRQGPFGIDALNQYMVAEMDQRIRPGQWWAIPIIITKNEPRQELYNGNCGILIGQNSLQFHNATAYFPEEVPFKRLPSFKPAFCLSIHQSQGSEFEQVLALAPPGSERFGREALYTAVTRAKKQVQIIAGIETIQAMLLQSFRKVSGFTARFQDGRDPTGGQQSHMPQGIES